MCLSKFAKFAFFINKGKIFFSILFSLSIVLLMSSCFSTSSIIDKYMRSIKRAIASQEDPEIVKEGMPTLLIMLDTAVEADPDNRDLLRVASMTYASYAQAFILPENENKRAAILYGRAKDYAMRLLKKYDFFANNANGSFEDFEKAVNQFDLKSVPDIYAAGNAWLGWILSNSDSMDAMAELPRAMALMKRVLELDDSFSDGGAHLVFGLYYAVQPPGAGRDLKKSKKHFMRAIELAGENNLLPSVAYAEFYATAANDHKLFEKVLKKVIKAEKSSKVTKGTNALVNAIALKRAKQLLLEEEDYFDLEED